MNYLRRFTLILVLISALFLLAACGGGEEETPEPTATTAVVVEDATQPAEEVEPTEEPEPTTEPTPEPTAEPVAELDFVEITNETLGISFSHPADWVVQSDEEGLQLASEEALLADDDIDVEEGLKVQFISLPTIAIAMMAVEEDATDPVVVLETFSSLFMSMGELEEDVSLTAREETSALTISDYDAAMMVYDIESEDLVGTVKFFAVADPDNDRSLIIVAASPAESEDEYFPIFEEVLETLVLSEPTDTFDLGDGLESGLGGIGDGVSQGFVLPGDVVNSTLATEETHYWEYIGFAGEQLDLVVTPEGDLDVVIDVLNSSGVSLLGGEQDLDFGAETVSGLEIPADDQYFIYVYGFAGAGGNYSLSISEAGSGGSSTSTGDIEVGTAVTASLEGSEEAHWTIVAEEGDFIDVIVTPTEDLDVVIDILDINGDSLYDSPTDASYGTEFMPANYIPESGAYTIVVYSFDGVGGDYELTTNFTNNNETNTVFFVSQVDYDEAGAEHVFPFNALEGDYVTAIVEPSDIEFDVIIYLYNDDTGELLEEVDASYGMESLTYQVSETGNYSFVVTGFEDSIGLYDIILIGSEPVIYELAVNDEVFGKFGYQTYLQYYLGGEAGETVIITVEPSPGQDVVLYITDLDGNILQQADAGGMGGVETIEFTFGEEGLVMIELEDFGQTQETFTMYIED